MPATIDDIFNAARAVISRIKIEDQFRTDLGLNKIFDGLETIDKGEPVPCSSIFIPDEDQIRMRPIGAGRDVQATIFIAAWCRPLPSGPMRPLLDLMQDLKAAFKPGNCSELDSITISHAYVGCVNTPKADGGTFARLLYEHTCQWREP
jgi:hypothetical protein